MQDIESGEVCLHPLKMYWSSLLDRVVAAQGSPCNCPVGEVGWRVSEP